MFRRNAGRFTHSISLYRPSAPLRDELGGIAPTVYEKALTLRALCTEKNQTRRQIIGDYVTTDTKYFVVRDLRSVLPDLGTEWRLEYGGFMYLINQVDLIDESRPYYIQITATAINAGGVAR